jgi:hypothetical protein
MPVLKADRRLYTTADGSECVEESDPRSAFLLVAAGNHIGAGAVKQYGLSVDRAGRIMIKAKPEAKQAPKPEDKQAPKLEDKAAKPKPRAKKKPAAKKK